MLRKKQKPTENTRTMRRRPAQQSGRAPVFSYYANRAPADAPLRERGQSTRPRPRLRIQGKRLLSYAPSVVAGALLVFCLAYISTLTTDPVVHLVGASPADKTLVADITTYQDDFKDLLDDSLFNRSKLFIDTNGIAAQMSEQFPELGDVSVVLPLVGRRPVLKVAPARPVLILSASGGPYVVDSKGRILALARETDSSLRQGLPVVRDESGLPIERGSTAITQETIAFIQEVTQQLSHAQVAVESLVLSPQANELHVQLEGQPYFVKFNMKGEGRLQAGTFLAVRERLQGEGKTPAEYIDVRVAEKAFYR